MSSPSPSNDGDAPKDAKEQITFRFCSECSNMLYPKEDEDAHKLQFTCRTCQYTEEATSSCVFRNVMNNAAGETAGVTQDVGSDPTVRSNASSLPTSTSTSTSAPTPTDDDPAVCLRCGVTLLHCNRCNEPVSVKEYNHFVERHPEFAVAKSLNHAHFASCLNAQNDREQAAWADRFSTFEELTIPEHSEDSIAFYLPLGSHLMALDDDPPDGFEGLDDGEGDDSAFQY
ncbi:hypothetical protein F4804DRAFT_64919 [Jackrogersella minutella]|nr:hypothetical protein F4804DRAFT_64919 [Jackrogersella minutella]